MDATDAFFAYHKATYLQRLISHHRFPKNFVRADGCVLACLLDVVPDKIHARWSHLRMQERKRNERADPSPAAKRLRATLLRAIAQAAKNTQGAASESPLGRKLDLLTSIFALEAADAEMLRLLVLIELDPALKELMDCGEFLGGFGSKSHAMAALLAMPRQDVRTRSAVGSNLYRARILTPQIIHFHPTSIPTTKSDLELSPLIWRICADDRIGPSDILTQFFQREVAPRIGLNDLTPLRADMQIVEQLLHEAWNASRAGVNVLLYGPPGVGKTEFARLLSATTQATAYSLGRVGPDGISWDARDRRMSFELFQRLSVRETRPLLIVDEADMLLAVEMGVHDDRGSKFNEHKAGMTQTLEENPIPVVWIVNSSDFIHPALKRRFSYPIRFRELGPRQRATVWQHIASASGQPGSIPTETVEDLARRYALSAGHISQAFTTWRHAEGAGKSNVKTLQRIVSQFQHLEFDGRAKTDKVRRLDPRYNPSVLQLDSDVTPDQIDRLVSRFFEPQHGDRKLRPTQVTLLFHGPPGSGKTEFAKYLASRAGHELQVERASDLVSPFVGMTERNIAEAFGRTVEQENILLLDEFDSLGFDRQRTTRMYESSEINEILQQIENFPGVLIACTNLMENLDQAIARRFTHKLRFGGVRREHRSAAVATYFADMLNGEEISSGKKAQLDALPSLYPGDLRAVWERLAAKALVGESISVDSIVSALEHEVAFHRGDRKPVGFMPPTVN